MAAHPPVPDSPLASAIDRTGYYPEIVAAAVFDAVGDEDIVSYYLHHEPTFERDEVRRHLSVLVLTPTRLVVAHTDEHTGDDLLPQPYTSTSTESIRLSQVANVTVTRMVPAEAAAGDRPAEALLAIGWGVRGRIELEPARCHDPNCEADHGYSGDYVAEDFSIRASAMADGAEAVEQLLLFASALNALTK